MDKYEFGEFIFNRRKELKMTQEELGSILHVTNKAVSKWETGETSPDSHMMSSLAKALKLSINELYNMKVSPRWYTKVNWKIVGLISSLIINAGLVTYIVIDKAIENKAVSLSNELSLDENNYHEYLKINPAVNVCLEDNYLKITGSIVFVSQNDFDKIIQDIEVNVQYAPSFTYLNNSNEEIKSTFGKNSKTVYIDKVNSECNYTLSIESNATDLKTITGFNIESFTVLNVKGKIGRTTD
ncbi:MAG: helix-turn-helix transcriptional regulator [Bacilli bacterium]|nr:helix-turn-helix transcriptional regulator [Bacilli bacterium]